METSKQQILDEVRQALAGIDERQQQAFVEALATAPRVFVTGRGRSGLVAAAFAARLAQLGTQVYFVGEPTTPAITPGALLVACSGSGRTRGTLLHAEQARAAGAEVWTVTQASSSPLATAGSHTVVIPVASSDQPGASAFEQALLLFLDSVVLGLMAALGETPESMLARHANLE
ncbi:MAG: SIS domain-containing protein [Armatimonadota bacterium]|nr:MAG: SIS domain-containing protein [Armatimonadota bacterium]